MAVRKSQCKVVNYTPVTKDSAANAESLTQEIQKTNETPKPQREEKMRVDPNFDSHKESEIFSRAQSAQAYMHRTFINGMFKYTFLNRSRNVQGSHFVRNAQEFNLGVVRFKNDLCRKLAEKINAPWRVAYFDQNGARINPETGIPYYIELMNLAKTSFIPEFKMIMEQHPDLHKDVFDAFSAYYILNNFDDLIEEKMEGIVSLKTNSKGLVSNTQYAMNLGGHQTVYWANDTHEEHAIDKYTSNLAKFIVSNIPRVIRDSAGHIHHLPGQYLSTADLFMLSGILKQAEFEFNVKHVQEIADGSMEPLVINDSPKEALYRLLVLERNENGKTGIPVLDEFGYDLAQSLSEFLYGSDNQSDEMSVKEIFENEFMKDTSILDIEYLLAHEINKTVAPTYLQYNSDGKVTIKNYGKQYRASNQVIDNLQNFLFIEYHKPKSERIINATNSNRADALKDVEEAKQDPYFQTFCKEVFEITDVSLPQYEEFFKTHFIRIKSLMSEINLNMDNLDKAQFESEEFLYAKIESEIESLYKAKGIKGATSFYDLKNDLNKFLSTIPITTFDNLEGGSIPVYRLNSAMFNFNQFITHYKATNKAYREKMNLFVDNPNILTERNAHPRDAVANTSTATNTEYKSPVGYMLDAGTSATSTSIDKMHPNDQIIGSFVGNWVDMRSKHLIATQIAPYSDKSSIGFVQVNTNARIRALGTSKQQKTLGEITYISLESLLSSEDPETIIQYDYYYRKNAKIDLVQNILTAWNTIFQQLGLTQYHSRVLTRSELANAYKTEDSFPEILIGSIKILNNILKSQEFRDSLSITAEAQNTTPHDLIALLASKNNIELIDNVFYAGKNGQYEIKNALLWSIDNLRTLDSYTQYMRIQARRLSNSPEIQFLKRHLVKQGKNSFISEERKAALSKSKQKKSAQIAENASDIIWENLFASSKSLNGQEFEKELRRYLYATSMLRNQFMDLVSKDAYPDKGSGKKGVTEVIYPTKTLDVRTLDDINKVQWNSEREYQSDSGELEVATTRSTKTKTHYGNPFSHANYAGVFKVDNVRTAVELFEKWLRGSDEEFTYQEYNEKTKKLEVKTKRLSEVDPERRQWILNQINSGKLDNARLVYYTYEIPDLSYGQKLYDYETAPNHAHILQKLIIEHKNNGKTVREVSIGESEYSEQVSGMSKRMVLWPATVENFSQDLIDGVPPTVHVAIVEDANEKTFNIKGESHKQDIFDGAGYTSMLYSLMEDRSVQGRGVFGTKKTLGVHVSDHNSALFKWAEFPLTNARVRNSVGNKYDLRHVIKKMHDKYKWDESIDITQDMFNPQGMNILNYTHGRAVYFQEGLSYYRVDKIKKTSNPFEYTISLTEVNAQGQPSSSQDIVRNVTIRSIYDIWTALGAENSMELNDNGNLVYSEINYDVIYGIITHVGTCPLDVAKHKKLISAKNVHQPLKNMFVAILANKGAVKRGASNINTAKSVWSSPEAELATFEVNTQNFGIQLDANHASDMSELTEMSQTISALAANGYTRDIADEAYSAIADLVKGSYEKISKQSSEILNGNIVKVLEQISRNLIETLAQENNITTAQALIDALAKDVENRLKTIVPISDKRFYKLFVKEIFADLNKSAIKRKYTGMGGVINPSSNIFQVYHIDGVPYTSQDFTKIAIEGTTGNPKLALPQATKKGIQELFNGTLKNLTPSEKSEVVKKLVLLHLANPDTPLFGKNAAETHKIILNAIDPNVFGQQVGYGLVETSIDNIDILDHVLWNGHIVELKDLETYHKFLQEARQNPDQPVYISKVHPTDLRPQIEHWKSRDKNGVVVAKNTWAEPSIYMAYNVDDYSGNKEVTYTIEQVHTKNPSTPEWVKMVRDLLLYSYDAISATNILTNFLKKDAEATKIVKKLIYNLRQRTAELHHLNKDLGNLEKTENDAYNFVDYFCGEDLDLSQKIDYQDELDLDNFNECLDYAVSEAEVILPKIYATQFGIHDVNLHNINLSFFKKQNTYYERPDINEHRNIDFLVRTHTGNFSIVLVDSLADIDSSYGKDLYSELRFQDGWRLDEEGHRLYEIDDPNTVAIFRDENGHETICIKKDNAEQVLETLFASLQSSKAKANLMSIQPFLENAASKELEYENTSGLIDLCIKYNHVTTHNKMLKADKLLKGESLIQALQQVYQQAAAYKNDVANILYNSFKRTLRVISTRIPTQALQSFMIMRTVALTDDPVNNVYVSRWQLWLQGSDLDIDKSYMMGVDINSIGEYNHWSPLADYRTSERADISDTLPKPSGKEVVTTETYYQAKTKNLVTVSNNPNSRMASLVRDYITVVAQDPERTSENVNQIFKQFPELHKIGTKEQYLQYLRTIYPNTAIPGIYWHGTNADLSNGLLATKTQGSGAPETGSEFYLARQAYSVLQYINGINRKIPADKQGFEHWNKLWWTLKEIMSNGRRENDEWKDIVIGPESIRQEIPNKRGQFDRTSIDIEGHGKYLLEIKRDYGYENKSDAEFFQDVFGIKFGKDTFNTWTKRNKEIFRKLLKSSKQGIPGLYPVLINSQSPIIEEGQNTYYEEERGLFTQAKQNSNDAIASNHADNEFGSDVVISLNPQENIHFLGTAADLQAFKEFVSNAPTLDVVAEQYGVSDTERNLQDTLELKIIKEILEEFEKTGKFEIDIKDVNNPIFKELLRIINKHNRTQVTAEASRNLVANAIAKVSLDGRNMLSGYSPIDKAMALFTDAIAKKSKEFKIPLRNLDDGISTFRIQYENAVGKQDVGIMANGLKIFFAMSQYFNRYYNGDFGPINQNVRGKFLRILKIGDPKNPNVKPSIKSTISDIQMSKAVMNGLIAGMKAVIGEEQFNQAQAFANDDASLLASSLVSLATDNAKELALAKLNAGLNLACMHVFLTIMGYSPDQIVDYTTSKLFQDLTKLIVPSQYDLEADDTINNDVWKKLEKMAKNNPNYNIEDVNQLRHVYNSAQELTAGSKLLGINQGIKVDEFSAMMYREKFQKLLPDQIRQIRYDMGSSDKLYDTQKGQNTSTFTEFAPYYILHHLGLPVDVESPLYQTLSQRIESINKRALALGVSVHEAVDMHRFISDENYQQLIIDIYDVLKENFNMYDILVNSKNFYAMVEAFDAYLNVFENSSSRANWTLRTAPEEFDPNLIVHTEEVVVDENFPDKTEKREIFKMPKVYTAAIGKKAQRLYDDWVLSTFLKENRDYDFIVGNTKVKMDSNAQLKAFVSFMNNKLIPKLRELYPNNGFLNSLKIDAKGLASKKKGKQTRTTPVRWVFNFDIDILSDPSHASKYYELVNGFDTLVKDGENWLTLEDIFGEDVTKGQNIKIGDLFFLYDQVLNFASFGQGTIDKAFDHYVSDNPEIATKLAQIEIEADQGLRQIEIDPEILMAHILRGTAMHHPKLKGKLKTSSKKTIDVQNTLLLTLDKIKTNYSESYAKLAKVLDAFRLNLITIETIC